MLGSALYYPHIDINDSTWLRSAILFWDSLQTIAPRAINLPYKNKDTEILWREGYLEPLRCDLHPNLLDTLGKRVIALMDQNEIGIRIDLERTNDPNVGAMMHVDKIGWEMRNVFRRAQLHPEKLSPELIDLAMRAGLARMSEGKLSYKLLDFLREYQSNDFDSESFLHRYQSLSRHAERFRRSDVAWLLVDNRFAEIYMSALAALLAKETNLAALTNESAFIGINLHTLVEDIKPTAPSEKKGALVSFIMEMIRVSPETRVDKLLAFRRSRTDQLAELSVQFDDLSSKISNSESAKELNESVRDVYVKRIRPRLESLKNELKDNSIQAVWEGVQRAVTVSVPASSAVAYFTGFSGTTLLAAGAAVAVTDVAIKTHLARKRARRASPYSYLLDVQSKFSQETAHSRNHIT